MKAIVVGYGLAGMVFHAPLLKAAGIEVAAVVVRDAERRALAARDAPDALLCDDLNEALSRVQATLVVIASPTATHAPLALAALAAGCHVVVDKPVALTAVEFSTVMAAADEAMRWVIPFQNRRWDADFLSLKQLIDADELGDVMRYEARFDRYNPVVKDRWREHAVAGAGMLYDLAPHLVDQAVQLFGRPDWVFCALLKQRAGALTNDGFELMMGSDDAAYPHVALGVSMFAAAGDVPSGAPRFKVYGQRASWLKGGFDPQEALLRQGRIPQAIDWVREDEAARGRLIDGATQAVRLTDAGVGCWPYFYAQVKRAIECDEPVPVFASEALLTCEIIDAALLSAERGARVRL
jgi:predicted dehydrogenase